MKDNNNTVYTPSDPDIDITKPLTFTDNKTTARGWVPVVIAGGRKPYPLKGIVCNDKNGAWGMRWTSAGKVDPDCGGAHWNICNKEEITK